MVDVLALLLALCLSRVRNPYYLDSLHRKCAVQIRLMLAKQEWSGGFVWGVGVFAPFLLLWIVDGFLARSILLDFAYSAAAVTVLWKITHFNYFLERTMSALYGNDWDQVRYLIRKWKGESPDGSPASTEDVLEMCANRLCHDLFLSMFWFGVFGPAGAYLGVAHHLIGRFTEFPKPVDRIVRLPAEALMVVLIALTGNFGPAISKIHAPGAVGSAMIAASRIDPINIDIEQVPGYRALVGRMFWACCIATAVLAILFN